jgi:hypothetical protein
VLYCTENLRRWPCVTYGTGRTVASRVRCVAGLIHQRDTRLLWTTSKPNSELSILIQNFLCPFCPQKFVNMLLSLLYLFPLTLFVSWLVNAEPPSAFTDTSRCPHQPHKIHIFSRRPLTIYIEDFVSTDEATQLIKLAYI